MITLVETVMVLEVGVDEPPEGGDEEEPRSWVRFQHDEGTVSQVYMPLAQVQQCGGYLYEKVTIKLAVEGG